MAQSLVSLTIPQIKAYAVEKGIKPPSALRKAELIAYIEGKLTEPSFDRQSISCANITPCYADPSLSWREHLQAKGWAVVPIPDFNAGEYVEAFWDWLESSNATLNRKHSETWATKNLPPSTNGIFKQWLIHEPFVWEIRERCAPIFAQLWGTEELLTSFDGGCFLPPAKEIKDELKSWAHFEAHRIEEKLLSIQGVVNLLESGPEDGGFMVLEGSRDRYAKYIAKYPSSGLKWGFVNLEDEIYADLPWVKVCAAPGELILFDSKCVHMNCSGRRERLVTYVCMYPLKEGNGQTGATKEHLAKRIKWYEEGRGTSHAAYGAWCTANPKEPRTYGKEVNRPAEIKIAQLNSAQRRLVGYDV